MRDYLVDLISRMALLERGINSVDSISWHAHREAEALTDFSMAQELDEYVKQEPDKKRRREAYFIIGKIGLRCRGSDCAQMLLSRLLAEDDKYVLYAMLDILGDLAKPCELDLAPIYSFFYDERWLVRHSAIHSLRNSESTAAEDHLLDLLSRSPGPADTTYCHATLSVIGTSKAIPILERGLASRKRDVKESAQFAIEAIKARETRPSNS